MPAVTVDNPLTLPRVPEPNPALKDRPVVSITTAPRGLSCGLACQAEMRPWRVLIEMFWPMRGC